MDGYSVTEAASVLGVPIERVWELLARGVLAGAPEGETGMRVFLQPRAPASAPRDEPPPAINGGSQEPQRELSPFRELLTEFRSLTERYGQALLALGESRGEVAALRSRVDLLEARMDLRLPGGSPLPPSGWGTASAPFPGEQTVTPTPPAAEVSPEDATDHVDEAAQHRARARGPRRATESFAEALARAEDPSAPELPRSEEVAEALAALHHEPADAADAILPRELPAADEVPVADEAVATGEAPVADAGSADEDEVPGAAADEPEPERHDVAAVTDTSAADAEADALSEPMEAAELDAVDDGDSDEAAARDAPAAAEGEDTASSVEADDATDGVQPSAAGDDIEEEPAGDAPAEATPDVEPAAEREPVMAATANDEAPAGSMPEPPTWDESRYTATIDEPDWLEAEAVEEPAVSEVGARPAERAGTEPPPEAAEEPAASESGAERDEPSRPSAAAQTLPGSDELTEALAGLDAVGARPEPEPSPEVEPGPELPGGEANVDWPPPLSSEPEPPPAPRTYSPPPLPPSALRYRPVGPPAGSAGPAGRAYRRLRRIFPN